MMKRSIAGMTPDRDLTSPTAELCHFVERLALSDVPPRVVEFTKGLMIDWLGSAYAGKGAHQVEMMDAFARAMGPLDGPSTVIPSDRHTSPYFAAMINAAASHVVEQDDVHNAAVFHPAAVVFPAVVAVAEAEKISGREILEAAIAGYEVGIRVGEFLGRTHYEVFHTTGTAGTVAAAVSVGKLLRLPADILVHAVGSAGTQAAGLWEFIGDAGDSKQLHTAKAASSGLLSAYLARDGFRGALRILEGPKGMAAGMSRDADPARLTDRLGKRWATEETSFKWHASCRHTHPAADALLLLMRREGLAADDITEVVACVHQAAIDVLGGIVIPATVHQAKFSMGTVLALIAVDGVADLDSFEHRALKDERVQRFLPKVRMEFDGEVESFYPRRWIGKVRVNTTDGRVLTARVDEPKGDPGNTLTREEIEAKAIRLATFRDAISADDMRATINRIWRLDTTVGPVDLFERGER